MTDLSLNTTVGVCDTQPVTAAGVRAVLDTCPDLDFLWASTNLDDALRMTRLYPPRVVLADKGIGVSGLVHWVLNLRASDSKISVVIWGTSMTEAEALRFVQAGAKGVIRKAAQADMLLACLRSASAGSTWMEDSIFRSAPRANAAHRSDLTPREAQVFGLVEQGLTNSEIARELGIRPGTVKIHLKHLYEKTGMRSRYHLALSGLKNKGILSMTA
jgi:two-component system, NarL family, nitrate/nitrite response regulator NarL